MFRFGFHGMGPWFCHGGFCFYHGFWGRPYMSGEEELWFLKRQAEMLKEELRWLEERIEKLEKEGK
ncbi:MAG: DUF5320 domain-containing protein [Candidatus Caldatribacteriaceae bacterium]